MAAGDRGVCRGVSVDLYAGSGVDMGNGHLSGSVCGGDRRISQARGNQPSEAGRRGHEAKEGCSGSSKRGVGFVTWMKCPGSRSSFSTGMDGRRC